jgi:hypothetical protein
MKQPQPITKGKLEALKAKLGIDQQIAERWDKPEHVVKDDFDPRLVKLILDYLQTR